MDVCLRSAIKNIPIDTEGSNRVALHSPEGLFGSYSHPIHCICHSSKKPQSRLAGVSCPCRRIYPLRFFFWRGVRFLRFAVRPTRPDAVDEAHHEIASVHRDWQPFFKCFEPFIEIFHVSSFYVCESHEKLAHFPYFR